MNIGKEDEFRVSGGSDSSKFQSREQRKSFSMYLMIGHMEWKERVNQKIL